MYDIGDLVSVVDNWYDMVAEDLDLSSGKPMNLPLFTEGHESKKVHGLIVDKEVYPGTIVNNETSNPYRVKHNGLYHVLLSNGKVKKYFHNRLEKISSCQVEILNESVD